MPWHFPLTAACALGVALPFGHIDAGTSSPSPRAATLGVYEIRLAPRRMFLALCLSVGLARASGASPKHSASSPSLRSAHQNLRLPRRAGLRFRAIAARDIAAEIANEARGLFDSSSHLHISGCAKGCAHPAEACAHPGRRRKRRRTCRGGTAKALPLAYTPGDEAARASAASPNWSERAPPARPPAARRGWTKRRTAAGSKRMTMPTTTTSTTATRSTSAPSPSSARRPTFPAF